MDRVTRAEPCEVCGKPDWCVRLDRYALCMRIESQKPVETGGWLHARTDVPTELPPRPVYVRHTDEECRDRWTRVAVRAHQNGLDKIGSLAVELGVNREALVRLGVGYMDEIGFGPACWTFPEKNAQGWIVGILRRMADTGLKRFLKGSHRGLVYADDWAAQSGPVCVVEGGSDVAAGLCMGMCVIGRPSNIGGVAYLAEILKPHGNRKIVVYGENDHKDNVPEGTHKKRCMGCPLCWPGAAGAMRVASSLAKRLGRSVGVNFPPKPYKDVRDWYASRKKTS